jgi:nucleoside-diphosphate-sugar epimerase
MTDRAEPRVAVVGAASQIGAALLPRLADQGYQVIRIGRSAVEPVDASDDVVHVFDSQRGCFDHFLAPVQAVISLAPLPAIGLVLKMAHALGASRLIAFGSTGRFSKANSTSALERDFVREQEQAERILGEAGRMGGIRWTLFRPTMIYGADMDQTVSFILSIVEKFGFFPLPRGANGMRQPVHVDDLAAACVAVLGLERTFGRAYDLGGGETMSYPQLVRRIFSAAQKKPRILPLPVSLFYGLVALARALPNHAFVRMEMVDRMFLDLTADNGPASRDFGYRPRAFLLEKRALTRPVPRPTGTPGETP